MINNFKFIALSLIVILKGCGFTGSFPSSASSLISNSADSGSSSIINNGPLVFFSSTTSTVAEGSAGNTPITVTITLAADATETYTVPYTVAGTATSGVDHDCVDGNITITSGTRTGSINCNVIGDGGSEGLETITFTFGSSDTVQYTESTTLTYTIVDFSDYYYVTDTGTAGDNATDSTCETAGGECTITAAVSEINAGNIKGIFIPGGHYLVPTPLEINNATSIIGEDKHKTVLEGDFGDDVLRLNANMTLSNFTISKGRPGIDINDASDPVVTGTNLIFKRNGGISNGPAVELDDGDFNCTSCIFWKNHSGSNGGAIYGSNVDVLDITDSLFYGNTSLTRGGAIYTDANLTNCDFLYNIAGGGGGGAIDTAANNDPNTIARSRFYRNISHKGGIADGEGGALRIESTNTITMNNNSLIQNIAESGGGVWLEEPTGTYNFNNNTITMNYALEEVGGIHGLTGLSMNLRNNLIFNNWVDDNVTFIDNCDGNSTITSLDYNLSNTAADCNVVDTNDAAVLSPNINRIDTNGGLASTATINTSSSGHNLGGGSCPADDVTGKTRTDGTCDSGAFEYTANSPSGLYYAAKYLTLPYNIAMTAISPSKIEGTVTSYSIDPALPAGLNFDTETGEISGTPQEYTGNEGSFHTITATGAGGSTETWLWVKVLTTFTVDSTLDTTDASAGDGNCDTGASICTLRAAVEEAEALPGGQIIYIPASTSISIGSALPDTATDMYFVGEDRSTSIITASGTGYRLMEFTAQNQTEWINLTIQGFDRGAGDGGVLYYNLASSQRPSIVIQDSTLNNNRVTGASGDGGALYFEGFLSLHIINSTFSNNSAGNNGGAIFLDRDTSGLTLTIIENTTFISNSSDDTGGAIHVDTGALWIDYSLFESNSSTTDLGGAIYNIDSIVHSQNTSFYDNQAVGGGATLYNIRGGLILENNSIYQTDADAVLTFDDSAGGEDVFISNSLFHHTGSANTCEVTTAGTGYIISLGGNIYNTNDADCSPNGTYDTVSNGVLDLSSTTTADWFVDVLFDAGGSATGAASFQNGGCAAVWDAYGQSKTARAPCDSGSVEN